MVTKYIKTENNQIIVFPEYYKHSDFKHFKPKSAGFISIGARGCSCYGESISLGLNSDPSDGARADRQILGL